MSDSRRLLAVAVVLLLLTGCMVKAVADTAVDIVKVPVNVVSAGVDAATTSQSEADERRGREFRKQEEERGRLARQMLERCQKGRQLPTDICQPVQPR